MIKMVMMPALNISWRKHTLTGKFVTKHNIGHKCWIARDIFKAVENSVFDKNVVGSFVAYIAWRHVTDNFRGSIRISMD